MRTHKLLQRQLRRYFDEGFTPPPEWQAFLDAVDTAYHEYDQDLELLERSLELSSQELLQANSEMRAVIQAFPDLFFWLDHSGTIINYQGSNTTGLFLQPEQFAGKRIQDIPLVDVSRKFQEALNGVIKTKQVTICEYLLPIQNQHYHFEARLLLLPNQEILVIIRDITERKQVEEQMLYLSMHDADTGLFNRAYFEEEMQRLKSGRHNPVGLIICDLDGLKLVNDTLGHEAGDTLLRNAARVLKESVREGDMVARIGGDEFAILLPGSNNQALRLAMQRIREGVARYNASSPRLALSISIGYAVMGKDSGSLNSLFRKADDNMYREKFKNRRSASLNRMQTLMNLLEPRDFIAEGHAHRMQNLVQEMTCRLGLSERSTEDLLLLAQFHDIGNIGIPDHILFKPAPLSSEEIEEMHQHCEIGYRIAESAPLLSDISDWILKHHEWWNGHGYPLGLSREDIPLECRILALVDAFDAMTNDRPHRQAMRPDIAIAEIRKRAGSQFDPELLPCFIEIIEKMVLSPND